MSKLTDIDLFLVEKAEAIRALEREAKSIVLKVAYDIGGHLSDVRDHLSRNNSGDGTWLAWLEREFPAWGSQRTAYNYIGVFKFVQRHGGQLATFANTIDLSAVYLLGASSTPPEVVADTLDRAAAGERISRQDVKASVSDHKHVEALQRAETRTIEYVSQDVPPREVTAVAYAYDPPQQAIPLHRPLPKDSEPDYQQRSKDWRDNERRKMENAPHCPASAPQPTPDQPRIIGGPIIEQCAMRFRTLVSETMAELEPGDLDTLFWALRDALERMDAQRRGQKGDR
jgi:hypothetical protein